MPQVIDMDAPMYVVLCKAQYICIRTLCSDCKHAASCMMQPVITLNIKQFDAELAEEKAVHSSSSSFLSDSGIYI